MSAIAQYVQQIMLTAYFNVIRWIAGMQVGTTDIQGRLYLTADQMAELLGVTRQNLSYHLNKVFVGLSANNGTQTPFAYHYLTVYSAPVTYARDPSNPNAGGGGGTKQTKFYDLEILLLIAERMENNPRKEAILAEGRAIVATDGSQRYCRK